MAAYLEFHLKGGGCALVDAGMVGAVIAAGHDVWKPGTPDKPTRVVLRAGETIDVIGESPGVIVARLVDAREKARVLKYETNKEVYVDWLTPLGEGVDAAGDRDER
jgi:hypothetical protein